MKLENQLIEKLHSLVADKKFADADALLLGKLESNPSSKELHIEYCKIAEQSQNWSEVIARSELLRKKYPDNFQGYRMGAAALRETGEFAQADALLQQGMEACFDDQWLLLESCKVAAQQKNWSEVVARSELLRKKYPDNFQGYRMGAVALRETGEFVKADTLLQEGMNNCVDDQWLLVEYYKVAEQQKNWPEVIARTELLRKKYPENFQGYRAGAFALKEMGELAKAKDLIKESVRLFPQNKELRDAYCNLWLQWIDQEKAQVNNEAFWLKDSFRPSVDELTDYLLNFDVISFDIFDTAVFRAVDLPQDIFTIMALEMGFSDFLNVRKKAENRAREHKRMTCATREIVLDDIWQILETEYGIDARWKEREIELELAHSVVNPYIKNLYDTLLAAGKTLVFMTDMYLPKAIIERLLVQAGYQNYDHIFLSNELGACKGDGSMQPYLATRYPMQKIIHIGDNLPADVQKTKAKGIDAWYNIDQRRLRNEYNSGKANMASSFYRAVINNSMNNGMSFGGDIHYQHGFRVGGILVAGYCQFLNEIAKKRNCDKILFLARDCAVISRIYNAFYREFDNEYVAISRNAILAVSGKRYFYDYIGRSVLRQIGNQRGSATIEEVFKETGFDYLIDKLEQYDIEKYAFPQSFSTAKIEEFLYAEQETIVAHKQKSIEAAKQYFRQVVGDAKNVLIVDIGWTGTCIAALHHFLQSELPDLSVQACGALLCTSRNEAVTTAIEDNVETYLYSPYENMDLTRFYQEGRRMTTEERDLVHMPLEYLFTSDEASLIDYNFDEQGQVVLQRTDFSPQNADEIISMQNGMFDFCKTYQNYIAKSNIAVRISPYLAQGPLNEAIRNKEYSRAVYGNFHYDATFPLFGDIGKKTLFAHLFPMSSQDAVVAENTPQNAKRVLFVSPEMTYTGTPQSLLRIATVAKEAGYFVEAWTAKAGPFMQEFVARGIGVQVVPESKLGDDNIKKRIATFDVAVCNTIVTDVYVRAFETQKIPVAWYIREATNIPDFCMANPERLQILQTHKGLVCVSDYAAKAINRFTPMPIRVVHNAVEDESHFALPRTVAENGKVRFIQLGTIEYRKGYDLFIRAYKTLPEAYKERIELYFAGGFINSGMPFASYVFSEIENEENIHFLGQIRDKQKKIEIMSQMDAVVVVSRDESCSLVALEGAMLSKPLIVSENVGAKYMVSNNNGLIIPSGSVSALRSAFMSFVDRRDELATMGQASRQMYDEKASMAVHRQDIIALLEDGIQSKINSAASKKAVATSILTTVEKRDRIVISLTSHPPRMPYVAQSVASLFQQTMPADRVVLYLAKEQFPDGDNELPTNLLALKQQGLEIVWCNEDLKPHKKYYYAMQEEPNALVIILDDDVVYDTHLVENLYRSYVSNPKAVHCMRSNLMLFRPNGSFRSYDNWVYDYRARRNSPTYRLLPTGIGGVLYPPGSVPPEAFDSNAIINTCLRADDLWLKIMTTLNGYPSVLASQLCSPTPIDGSQVDALWVSNTKGDGNDVALSRILDYIESKYGLREELMKRLRGVGRDGEFIGPDTVENESLLFVFRYLQNRYQEKAKHLLSQ